MTIYPTDDQGKVDYNGQPEDQDIIESGFGGSVFVGYQFNDRWGADVEYVLMGLNTTDEFEEQFSLGEEVSDINSSASAVMVNGRYILPIGGSENNPAKWSVFISPGIGFGNFSIDYDLYVQQGDDKKATFTNKTVNSSFVFQVKAGAAYRFNYSTEAFAQVRYLVMPGVISGALDFTEDDKTFSSFSPEIGMRFRF